MSSKWLPKSTKFTKNIKKFALDEKNRNVEVDFIMRDQDMNYAYLQVAQTISGGLTNDKGVPKTEEREYRALEMIKDNYPKYLLTMDRLLQKRNGIKHLNLIDFILQNKSFD